MRIVGSHADFRPCIVLQSPANAGLSSLRENYQSVGTAENYPGCNPGVLLPPNWTIRDSGQSTQDHVLGNFQPSLQDCSLAHANPGLHPGLLPAVPTGLNFER
jgi:hypothetical protein